MNIINIESIDLNLLKVFEALYEEGSASRAAVRLGLTQSAVSAALGRLRTAYGDRLFERTSRGMTPTSRSHELKPVVSEALNQFRKSLSMVASKGGAFHGRTISLGLSDDYEVAIGPALVNQLRKVAPGIRLLLRQTYSQQATEMLTSRAIDLVITGGGFSSRSVARQTLAIGSYACLVKQSRLPARTRLTLEEYLQRKHILISSSGYVGIVDQILNTMGLNRHIEVSTTHFAAVPFLLSGNDAIATLPAHAAHTLAKVANLRVMKCPIELPPYSIELGWRQDVLRDPAVAAVKEAILAVFAVMRWVDQV